MCRLLLVLAITLEFSLKSLVIAKAQHISQENQNLHTVHTGVARIVSDRQRVSIIIRVHREETHTEGAVMGVRCAIFKVLQVDAQLIVSLDGEGMNLLQPCRGEKKTNKQTKK